MLAAFKTSSDYANARSTTNIEIRTPQESTERAAMTMADCAIGSLSSVCVDGLCPARLSS